MDASAQCTHICPFWSPRKGNVVSRICGAESSHQVVDWFHIAVHDYDTELVHCVEERSSLVSDLPVDGKQAWFHEILGGFDLVGLFECIFVDSIPEFCGKSKKRRLPGLDVLDAFEYLVAFGVRVLPTGQLLLVSDSGEIIP